VETTQVSNSAIMKRAMSFFAPDTLETYLQFYHPEVRLHSLPPGLPPGVEGARIFYSQFLEAFPDARLVADDVFESGDRIACRYTVTGTHMGEFMGVRATGKRVSITGITIVRMEDGRCVERWTEANLLGLLQQLEAVPAMAK
jgi:predicted ester cyclase